MRRELLQRAPIGGLGVRALAERLHVQVAELDDQVRGVLVAGRGRDAPLEHLGAFGVPAQAREAAVEDLERLAVVRIVRELTAPGGGSRAPTDLRVRTAPPARAGACAVAPSMLASFSSESSTPLVEPARRWMRWRSFCTAASSDAISSARSAQ